MDMQTSVCPLEANTTQKHLENTWCTVNAYAGITRLEITVNAAIAFTMTDHGEQLTA